MRQALAEVPGAEPELEHTLEVEYVAARAQASDQVLNMQVVDTASEVHPAEPNSHTAVHMTAFALAVLAAVAVVEVEVGVEAAVETAAEPQAEHTQHGLETEQVLAGVLNEL